MEKRELLAGFWLIYFIILPKTRDIANLLSFFYTVWA
jgi:hypothetical protein